MTYGDTKADAIKFIENGGKAVYVFGLWNEGGTPKSKEWALDKLLNESSQWTFGMGFHTLNFIQMNGETVLQFKELHENDMW